MNKVIVDGKVLTIDLDTEQILLRDFTEPDYPLISIIGRDDSGDEYQLFYVTTEDYRRMAKRIIGDKQYTPKLTRMALNFYEQLTHTPYCDWGEPTSIMAI